MSGQNASNNIQEYTCVPCFVFNIKHVKIQPDDPHTEEKFIHIKSGTPENRRQTKSGELTLVKLTCDECQADRGIYFAKLHVEYDLVHSSSVQLTAADLKSYIENHTKK